MEINKIYFSECLKFLKSMPKESVEAIVTDPPFGIGFTYDGKQEICNDPTTYWSWLSPIFEQFDRVLKPGGFCAIWQTQLYFPYFWQWFGNDIHIYAACKNFVQLRKTPINYGYDPVVMKYKSGDPLRPSKPKRSIDFFVANTAAIVSNTKRIEKNHPCPRPLDQVVEIISNFTIPDGVVLDPFGGSGPTAIASIMTGRKFILIENNKKYFDLSIQRLEEYLNAAQG